MKHTLAVLVQNQPGVLARIAGLFSRRGYNIESLVVGETEDPTLSRMTIVVSGNEKVIEQVTKQLNKLIDVIKVSDITNDPKVDRQMILIRVAADAEVRGEIMQIADIFRCRIVDIGRKSLIIEATGDEEKVQAIIHSLKPFGVQEMMRTGKIALVRSERFAK